mgnify:CR=1 FL=1|tara:strand:- start:389 stop:979 length:591 start_codon:yes stop_codon:yes gene_type:complete
MAVKYADGSDSDAGRVVQRKDTYITSMVSVSWSSNGDNQYMPSGFDVSFTPKDHGNLFLIECNWGLSGNNQMNVGFSFQENSTGSYANIHRYDTGADVVTSNATAGYYPTTNSWPEIMWDFGTGAHGGNNEIKIRPFVSFLTELNNTSGSGAVTWKTIHFGGESSPMRVNLMHSHSGTHYWSMPCVSCTSVTEIAR